MANGRGRDRRRETHWRGLVRGQRASGLTIREFCRRSGLAESAFYFWRGELERREGQRRQAAQALGAPAQGDSPGRARQPRRERPSTAARPVAQASFVPVRLVEEPPSQAPGRIEIELPGGRRVHVTGPVSREDLADVLAALSQDPTSAGWVAPKALDRNGASGNSHRAEGRPC
jgi:hypothetical protein